ncbi:MAG: FeoA domain-containing protein [Fimbriimonadaceae bacterium]|jgi:Fe2+ transport system protein FeoA|nr:FeoA domain-containing protein [Fimbriimonadaceae bacterium]
MDKTLTFFDLRRGMSARVLELVGDQVCPRLVELGLLPGTEFKVTKVAPLGDPIEIRLRGFSLCLRREECGCLRVQEIAKPPGKKGSAS